MDAVRALDVEGVKKAIEEGKPLKGALFELLDALKEASYERDASTTVELVYKILGLIIDRVDPNEVNEKGYTPLAQIANTKSPELQMLSFGFIDALLKRGANVNDKVDDAPLLLVAAYHSYPYLVQKLSEQEQLDWKVKDPHENTIIHYIVWYYGYPDESAKKILLSALNVGMVDINAQNLSGQTAIFLAAEQSSNDMVTLLLELGANPNIPDNSGKLPIDFVKDKVTLYTIQQYSETMPSPPAPKPADNKFLQNALKLRGFEVRAFMGDEKNIVPVYVTTLPKGTLLFRGVDDIEKFKEDILGIRKASTSFCLPPHYSVYFYPFPFADETVSSYKSVIIYTLIQDIKVACFINPCPMSRADRNIRDMPITSCDNIHSPQYGCDLTGRRYDPCFNHKFLTQNPDIVGMIGIAGQDRAAFVEKIKTDKTFQSYANKYFSTYTDSHSLYPGIPEIILYPRVARNLDSVDTILETDTMQGFVDWFRENEDTVGVAYSMYHAVPVRSRDALQKFLDGKIANGTICIDKTTGFFIRGSDTDRPLLLADEMSRMSESFPELIFTRAEFLPGVTTSGSGRRRTFRRKH